MNTHFVHYMYHIFYSYSRENKKFFQVAANFEKIFPTFEKKPTYKWICTVKTCGVQGSLIITYSLARSKIFVNN